MAATNNLILLVDASSIDPNRMTSLLSTITNDYGQILHIYIYGHWSRLRRTAWIEKIKQFGMLIVYTNWCGRNGITIPMVADTEELMLRKEELKLDGFVIVGKGCWWDSRLVRIIEQEGLKNFMFVDEPVPELALRKVTVWKDTRVLIPDGPDMRVETPLT